MANRSHHGEETHSPEAQNRLCAETGAAVSILLATQLGLPVSTTHCLAGSIAGVGAVQRVKAVRWGVAANILWAWVLTIPAAAVVAWLVFALIYALDKNV